MLVCGSLTAFDIRPWHGKVIAPNRKSVISYPSHANYAVEQVAEAQITTQKYF